MKAYIYVVRQFGSWSCKVTIAPEVDIDFWQYADGMLLWKAPLPLGIALEAAGHFNEYDNRDGQYVRQSKQSANQSAGMERLRSFKGWLDIQAKRWSGRKSRNAGQGREDSGQRGVYSGKPYQKMQGKQPWEPKGAGAAAERASRCRNERDDEVSDRLAAAISKASSGVLVQVEGAQEELDGKRIRMILIPVGQAGRSQSALVDQAALAADRCERSGQARGVDRAPAEALAAAAQLAAAALQGRALLRGEAHALLAGTAPAAAVPSMDKDATLQLASLQGLIQLRSAVSKKASREAGWPRRAKRALRCLRCGSGEEQLHMTPCAACGQEACAYCTACLTMGRSRECELLIIGGGAGGSRSSMDLPPPQQRLARWGLSPAQSAAAEAALHFTERPLRSASAGPLAATQNSFLLWAVTGAGKTEMVFPIVESTLLRGGKVLIATPRRDVVLELSPRIRKAFSGCDVVTLYGGSEQKWEQGDITLATTHQLLRFHFAFDLVIIDELDAFPYHNDPQLHYAANKSCAPDGVKILLSATPPAKLQQLARRGKLEHARVPVRFHRHPLPVPVLLHTVSVGQMLDKLQLPRQLNDAMLRSYGRGAQLFVFVQRISQVERMAALLRQKLNISQVAGTSSQDPERGDKVQQFRTGEIRILVTTTILERGVTIPRSDVFILDADGQLFDEASLVQMAGRAGRASDDPNGRVVFCAKERTRPQMLAVKHIKKMNRIARAKGYFQHVSK
ncbi:helicase-related protein [Paenibacillus sp. FSL H8-0537]|uniref:DEAD/DEAH box helicase n=1 Tax=Paenibacillus sp. FSL H8-0537 TaxID=2921399 RepID=UPI003101101E